MLIDAHVHLTDDELFILKDQVLEMLNNLDIIALSVSMDLKSSIRNLDLLSDRVLPFIGIHPWVDYEDVDKFMEFAIKNIDKVYGIGEIGLDRKYVNNEESYNKQKDIFIKMLELAESYNKPISVHSRGSLNDIFNILSSYNLSVLLHWFSGNKRDLKKAMDNGYYISYGPALLYANDKPSLLLESNLDLILIETDGPVRYARCFENHIALPSYLISVAYTVSNILNIEYNELCNRLVSNTYRYLKIDRIK